MQRTIENCTLIQKCVRKGIGEPQRFYNVNKCEGYQRGEDDDEPCEQCKACKFCIYDKDYENYGETLTLSDHGETLALSDFDSQPAMLVVNGLTVEECIEKQIKKKPIKKTNFGSDILDGKYCPRCDRMFDRTSKYCECCGQAIDWSDTNEKQ